ncbi:M4 family metallopeptidase [Streptomyces thermoviolaceus]|uniref:Neutral metalloproteinase n=1 Tax=Streptomyces thermoviolaceus subsp. thermoviolaceus TaxID=66860 RepID=A0ABX0YNL2_STRTL|nr:M4 family metallopeptidase [Streptomyces thermoviolaceus]MCM3266282.1 M4 family metallopeptidase [Streptomyces thermoviolaceus]NJP14125.1 peptidase M4 [Streptomyces thermoviolaceus subsp. thermoviolaceus]WTD47359.1 M4 family metallopeptidase [Streptomyces thermoviolaceus]GGV83036.1 peptidase [Streptomyces thermoviolaceus subsp. apingens]GHA91168.1 peptidase [Streptomyces thermoviolaceus subsp. thermoviolaceus]
MTPRYARHKRTTLAIATAVAAGALLSTGVAASASAQTTAASEVRTPAAAPAALSAAARTSLLQQAQADAAQTAQQIGLGAEEKLVAKDVVRDADGTVHTRYERTYAGLPVLGGDLVVHTSPAGKTKGVTKATEASIKVASLTPKVAAATAEKQAVSLAKEAGSAQTSADRAPRKVIWAATGKPVLAYETVVGGLQDDGTPNELHVITDAATGEKLYEYQGIKTGTGKTLYSGTVTLGTYKSGSTYQLYDTSRGGHKTYNLARKTSGTGTLFTDADDVWGTGTASSSSSDQTAAADAAYGAQVTWDFYKDTFGRNGIRNDGKAAYSRVHYSSGYVNAFWDDSCFCMTYGDGQGNTHPLTSLDVAGHEMSHGVTSVTAGLIYSGESGGLNEATSDILATGVEFYANNPSDPGDYLIGEKIDINGDGTPLRYMDKPSKDGASADYWSSSLSRKDVHYSSGVANHFFYLLSEGSGAKTINGVSYNSPTYDGSTVTGIGRDKALQIWYKALTEYMTSTTNYKGARTATLNAAADLYGSSSTEYKTVAAAWSAVNVN